MPPKKILIVDDDRNICEVLRLYLGSEGYQLSFAADGSAALDQYRQVQPDLILLDLMLPVINGWEVCKLIRQESRVPIIMLTAKESIDDKISGLDLGADDYIVKPFDPKEVLARIRALFRRAGPGAIAEEQAGVFQVGDLWVHAANYEVKVHGQVIPLKTKEMQLLIFLMENLNMVFSREQLLEKVWGYDFQGETRTVDVHIQRLRDKLHDPEARWQIKTIWGVGYKFEVN